MDAQRIEVRQPWWRERLGRLFNTVLRLLGVTELRDTQCGFKLFQGQAARRVFAHLTVERWAFDVEALLIAKWMGFKTIEVPVTWRNSADSRVRVGRDLARTLMDIGAIRWRWRGRRADLLKNPGVRAETGPR